MQAAGIYLLARTKAGLGAGRDGRVGGEEWNSIGER